MAAMAFALLAVAAALWILGPLRRPETFAAADYAAAAELQDLYALRDVAYDTLRDLEFDFRMGKMAESDYRELKTRYQGEAAEILRQIGALEERRGATPPAPAEGVPGRDPR
jgi:hypothetical protein